MKQATEKLLKSKPKEMKEEEPQESGTNMCQLKNHNHVWSKCPNNPNSLNFFGKTYTVIPGSKRYRNEFAKKAISAKKKVSVKKEDLRAISKKTKTPKVRIKDEENFDLNYSSNEED
jgi:hypothetical protein